MVDRPADSATASTGVPCDATVLQPRYYRQSELGVPLRPGVAQRVARARQRGVPGLRDDFRHDPIAVLHGTWSPSGE